MLLYHFPLNTQESIENFTNKGIKNDWYYKDSYRQNMESGGKISNVCCKPNDSRVVLPINSDTFTLAFRAFLSSDTSIAGKWRTFIQLIQGNTALNAFLVYSDLTYYYWSNIPNTRQYTLNKWTDVILVANAGTYSVYYDGVYVNSANISGVIDRICLYGRYAESAFKFNLPNQDIRIYDYSLSQAEINEYSRALVVHYPLQGNELNPSVLKDVSGFEDDYTSDSAITYGYNSPRNKYGVVTKDLLLKKGNLVNIRQLVENYDFHDGLNGWVANTDIEIVDGHLECNNSNTKRIGNLTPILNIIDGYQCEALLKYQANENTIGYNSRNNPSTSASSFVAEHIETLYGTEDGYYKRIRQLSQDSGKYLNQFIYSTKSSVKIFKYNLFSFTFDFGKNREPTTSEFNQMLGITTNDFIPYGNYVVKDTRKTIPQTIAFWCQYNDTWYHLAYNGDKYVNGAVNTDLFDTIYASLESGIKMSDFRVYATALSAEDIKNLYNSPISLDNKHNTMAFEFKENPLYPSKYWRTPTYSEMNYILKARTNAANLRTLGRVEISSGTYRNGLFLLPDGFTAPSGITVTITNADYTTNSYTLAQFKQLEGVGVVFMPSVGYRQGSNIYSMNDGNYHIALNNRRLYFSINHIEIGSLGVNYRGMAVRTIIDGTHFSTSATTKIDFAPANLQYHCTQHIWRFAEHSYDIIGTDNANISDSYNGWIDLFGYGTSGVNYSPTLHTTTNADYASGDIANTDNDWGINEIQSYDYNVKNFALNKNGIVQHNELSEYDLLPDEYQLVEYLESTGEQWIDTEYYPQLTDDFYAEVAFTELLQQNFGCLAYIGGLYQRCHFSSNAAQEKLQIFYSPNNSINKDFDTNFHIYRFATDRVCIDTTSNSNNNVYPNLSFYLFARNYTSLTLCKAKTKIFKVNGKVEMYPCYRKSDNKPGMYDIIRHKFFTNKGTGADFLVGDDVPKINGIYNNKLITNELIEQ